MHLTRNTNSSRSKEMFVLLVTMHLVRVQGGVLVPQSIYSLSILGFLPRHHTNINGKIRDNTRAQHRALIKAKLANVA